MGQPSNQTASNSIFKNDEDDYDYDDEDYGQEDAYGQEAFNSNPMMMALNNSAGGNGAFDPSMLANMMQHISMNPSAV